MSNDLEFPEEGFSLESEFGNRNRGAEQGFIRQTNSPGILVIDDQKRIVSANPVICTMLGYEPDELIGLTYGQICLSESVYDNREKADDDEDLTLPLWRPGQFIGKGKRSHKVDLLWHRINGKDGEAAWNLILVEDPLQRTVSASGLEAETVLRMIPGYIWSMTVNYETFHSTPNYYSTGLGLILGRDTLTNQDKTMTEVHSSSIHPDDKPIIQKRWQKAVRDKTPIIHIDYRIIYPDQSIHWVRDIVRITRLDLINIRLDGVMIDTSEAKAIETELMRRDEILTALGAAAKILLEPSDWDSGINSAIGSLGAILEASHVRIFKNWYEADEIITSMRYEWSNSSEIPVLDNPSMRKISFASINDKAAIKELTENRVFKGLTRKISSPALRKTLEGMHIVSLMVIPIYLRGGRWWGVIVFDHSREEHEWTFDEEDAMKTAADMLGSAMICRSAENELRTSQERYRTLVDLSPFAVIYVDLKWQIVLVNVQAVILFGYSGREELIGKNWMDLLDPHEREQVIKQTDQLLEKGEIRNLECNCIRQPGMRFPAEINISLMHNPQGDVSGFVCIHQDISERKISQKALNGALNQVNGYVQLLKLRNHVNSLFSELMNRLQSCATLEDIYALTGDYMEKIFPDHTGALYIFNPQQNIFEATMGWGEHVPGEVVFPPEDCCAIKQNRTHYVSDMQTRLRCKHVQTASYICAPLIHQKEITGILHMQDVSESPSNAWKQPMLTSLAESIALTIANLRLRQNLEYQSTHDHLTGLYNLRFMETALIRELHRAARHQSTLCLALFDVNHFKNINNLYGHKVGDEILHKLGNLLISRTRSEDILCRYGGDEFLLILPESSLEDSFRRAMELCQLVKEIKPEISNLALEEISLSFGMSAYPQNGNTVDELIKAADTALSDIKRKGGQGGWMEDTKGSD